MKVVCSLECNEAIQNPRLNCSVFMNDRKSIYLKPADIVFEGIKVLKWNGHVIKCIPTPGHTSDSISFIIDNNIFTGDALLRDLPTVTKLPSGNKEQQKETEKYLLSFIGLKAWPGHGEAFIIK